MRCRPPSTKSHREASKFSNVQMQVTQVWFMHASRLFSHPATLNYCPLHAQLSPARIVMCKPSPCAVSEQWHDSQGATSDRMCKRRDLSNQQASSACVVPGRACCLPEGCSKQARSSP